MMNLSDFFDVSELKAALDSHPIYSEIRSLASLRRFMEHHVYSVWDFMSLLKYLQHHVAPATVPWLPTRDAGLTLMQRFINEIVLGEETDEGLLNAKGSPDFISHFDLYLGAMNEVGADTKPVLSFLKAVRTRGIDAALAGQKNIPAPARRFMMQTFAFIATDQPHVVAAAFALGREQVIPGMFRKLLAEIGVSRDKAPLFHYYLDRHVHLDDELHGPLSLQLLEKLCGSSAAKRRAASKAGCAAIAARIEFWDGVRLALNKSETRQTARR